MRYHIACWQQRYADVNVDRDLKQPAQIVGAVLVHFKA